jgi:hypothetical protein
MKQIRKIILFMGILIPSICISQSDFSNSVDLIKKYKVKDVSIYLTRLNDSSKYITENLRSVYSFDTVGRLIQNKDYYNGELMGTWYFYYNQNTFDCMKYKWVSITGVVDSVIMGKNMIYQCQNFNQIWDSSSKYIISKSKLGLNSIMIIYSKVIENTIKQGENKYKTIDTDDPQAILKFEYNFYN